MLKYQIALTNVFWTSISENIRYWDTSTERESYFLAKNLVWSDLSNFPINDNYYTEITYLSQDNDIIKVLNCNYAVVKFVENNITSYLYYFAKVSQDSGRQVRVILTNDILTNYFIGNVKGLNACEIKRAFVDRFDKNGDNYVFKNSELGLNNENNPFYSNNNLNLAKKSNRSILKARVRYDQNSTENAMTPFDTATNGTLWLYVYLSPTKDMPYFDPLYLNGVLQPYVILCAPISDNYYVNTDTTIEQDYYKWTTEDIYYFLDLNNATANIITQKVSFMAPFNSSPKVLNTDYRLGTGVISYTENKSNLYVASRSDDKSHILIAIKEFDETYPYDLIIPEFSEIFPQTTFSKNEITGVRNPATNPFNLSGEVRNLTFFAPGGESYSMSFDKLSHGAFSINYSRTPDISRFMLKLTYSGMSKIYYNFYNGECLSFSLDESIPYAVEQLDAFLSQNKNFFQIIREKYSTNDRNALSSFGLNLMSGILSTGTGALIGGLTGGGIGAIAGGVGGLIGGLNNTTNSLNISAQNQRQIDLELKQAELTIDNYRAAPDTIKNLSTNVLFIASYMGDVGIYYAILEPFEYDFKRFDDYIFKYAYPLGVIGNIKDYTHSRVNFDYIECNMDIVNIDIPNEFKEYIKARLNKGLRLLHNDYVDYVNENYEVSIT